MTYDGAVLNNLDKCFNENGEFVDHQDYIDPDDFTYNEEEISPCIIFFNKSKDEKQTFTIGFKADGLLSIKKLNKVKKAIDNSDMDESEKELTQKDLYAFFRQDMQECLIWPSRTWSINQARRSLGNDDRLDYLLKDIQCFYEIANRSSDCLSTEFIHEIYEKLPNTANAFLNMPTLLWLSRYSDFKGFIEDRKLQDYVTSDNGNYITEIWQDYYLSLYIRTKKYRERHNKTYVRHK